MTFQIYSPTRIFFGTGAIEILKVVAKKYKHIFVLYSKSIGEEPKNLLGGSVESYIAYTLGSEPTINGIHTLAKYKTPKTDCVIGIGGGSVLDSAKLLAIQSKDITNFDEESSEVLPIITLPTTAGTGTEVTKSAIVNINGIKKGIRSEKLFPETAIIDPSLCDSLPEHLTRYTAFDAFAHSVETYCSKMSTPYTRKLSEESLKLIIKYLPIALKEFEENGKPSIETREFLSYAAMLQGITLSNSSTCLPHRIQYALSAVSGASHAQGLACIFKAWLTLSKPKIAGYKYTDLITFMNKVNINITLSDIGIKKGDIPGIIKKIEGPLENDPIFKNINQIKQILEVSL